MKTFLKRLLILSEKLCHEKVRRVLIKPVRGQDLWMLVLLSACDHIRVCALPSRIYSQTGQEQFGIPLCESKLELYSQINGVTFKNSDQ